MRNDGFGKRIKEARKKAGLNQAQFAEKLGMSSTALSRIESDQYVKSFWLVKRICNGLAVSADHIIFGERKN